MSQNLTAAEYAKHKLLMAAIKLFGESGVDSVSLREINRVAGAKNNSALHYHFKNKLGLVTAVINFIQAEFNSQRGPGLAALESKAKTQKLNVDEIMKLIIDPYVAVIENYDWGFNAVRAVARIEFDGDPEVLKILNQTSEPDAKTMVRMLKVLLPALPTKLLKQRINYAVKSVIHGFADHKNLKQSYLGDLSVKNLDQLAEFHLAMTVAILTAPVK